MGLFFSSQNDVTSRKLPRGLKRYFSAGKVDRLTSSWTTSNLSPDDVVKAHLNNLRARSREQMANNDYMRRFANLVRSNVVGPKGITLQSRCMDNKGNFDKADSLAVEQAFARWGRKGTCEVTKTMSWVDVQRLFCMTLIVDGEVLVREVYNNKSLFGYQVQMLDPALLDVNHNREKLANGNYIRFSIEFTPQDEPVAYYLCTGSSSGSYLWNNKKYVRIDASEIMHCFLPERVGQKRGIPCASTALLRMNQLGGYEEAAVVAARVGASQMGFFTRAVDGSGFEGDDTDPVDGSLEMDVEPGVMRELPTGVGFTPFDPDYPHAQYDAFVKACLRGISAGLGISYHTLANDLSGVNYTSSRTGALEDREEWKAMQEWMIDSFHYRVFMNWLPKALASGMITGPTGQVLPKDRKDKFAAHVWRPRRWAWVDPLKDTNANIIAINNGLKSRGEIIRESGGDPEQVWAELEAENERLAGVLPAGIPPAMIVETEKEPTDAE